MYTRFKGQSEGVYVFLILAFLGLASIGGCMYIAPQYSIWARTMDGKATLAEAEYTRQVQTLNAKARNASMQYDRLTAIQRAEYQAEAEIIRAKGVAKANEIIGKSLRNNEDYLKYLWINQLENNKNSVIYIPTEANLPILGAGKRK